MMQRVVDGTMIIDYSADEVTSAIEVGLERLMNRSSKSLTTMASEFLFMSDVQRDRVANQGPRDL